MEIRHDDAYWNDKYEDLLKIAGAFRDERNLLRSQLSEALGKIREHRAAEVTEQDAKLIEKRDIDYPGIDRAAREALEANLKQMESAGAIRGDEMRMVMETIKVPHHGPGLSEAEDAMKDALGSSDNWVARCNRGKGQLLLVYQSAPFGGIYYRLMDRETRRDIKGGIAKDKADMLAHLEDANKDRIYETRTYGMGVE